MSTQMDSLSVSVSHLMEICEDLDARLRRVEYAVWWGRWVLGLTLLGTVVRYLV